MNFIFVSDLHSNENLYNELDLLVDNNRPDMLIIGGDIFKYSNTSEEQIEFAEKFLYEFFKKIKTKVYIIPGNCDRSKSVKYLAKLQEQGLINILNLSGTYINNIKFIGYEYVNPTPAKLKDMEKRDLAKDYVTFDFPCLLPDENENLVLVENGFLNNIPSIEEELSILDERKSVWVMHAPPYGGILDLNYNNVWGGSKAIRKAIEKVKPILTLHGHIHEAPSMSKQWWEKIGETISVNPGSSDRLNVVSVEIDDYGKVISLHHNIYGELKR